MFIVHLYQLVSDDEQMKIISGYLLCMFCLTFVFGVFKYFNHRLFQHEQIIIALYNIVGLILIFPLLV